MTATADITPVSRADAVHRIAGHLADRDSYVLVAPPDTLKTLAPCLDNIPTWTAYLDNGAPFVVRTGSAEVLLLADLLTPTAAVLAIPKTVPPSALSEALGQEVPADGSQDIVILANPEAPVYWPLLYVDALAVVDPRLAALLHANHLPNLS